MNSRLLAISQRQLFTVKNGSGGGGEQVLKLLL